MWDYGEVLQIIDVDNTDKLPKRFRMTSTSVERSENATEIDWRGLAELNISGSGQFSQGGLRHIKRLIGEIPAVVVDLRQETHGFINGMAISKFAEHNEGNMGKQSENILQEERRWFEYLAAAPSLTFDLLPDKSADVPPDAAERLPRVVRSEEELAGQEGMEYVRFFVTDHHRPADGEVDRFISYVKSLPGNIWLHFHCRGGVGRTTTFMLLYDMMKNGTRVKLEDLQQRHRAIGGRDLAEMKPGSRKYQDALDRLNFVRKFYAYCIDCQGDFRTTWSEWLAHA